jgi:hypothetical protein
MSRLPPIAHPWIDSTRAPIYSVTFPVRVSDDELLAWCAVRETWAETAQFPVAWVVDLSLLEEVTAKQRRIFGDHLERFEPHDVAHNRGSALVVPNTFLRGVVTAIFWIKPPRFPNELFPTRALAVAWAEARLTAATPTAPLA